MDLGAYIGAKIDEAVDAYDSSTESVKENIETIDDALAVSEERQKWKQAIGNFKAEISEKRKIAYAKTNSEDATQKFTSWGRYWAHDEDLETIDKHTKELMK